MFAVSGNFLKNPKEKTFNQECNLNSGEKNEGCRTGPLNCLYPKHYQHIVVENLFQ